MNKMKDIEDIYWIQIKSIVDLIRMIYALPINVKYPYLLIVKLDENLLRAYTFVRVPFLEDSIICFTDTNDKELLTAEYIQYTPFPRENIKFKKVVSGIGYHIPIIRISSEQELIISSISRGHEKKKINRNATCADVSVIKLSFRDFWNFLFSNEDFLGTAFITSLTRKFLIFSFRYKPAAYCVDILITESETPLDDGFMINKEGELVQIYEGKEKAKREYIALINAIKLSKRLYNVLLA